MVYLDDFDVLKKNTTVQLPGHIITERCSVAHLVGSKRTSALGISRRFYVEQLIECLLNSISIRNSQELRSRIDVVGKWQVR